ncbi:MAG: flavin reductase family protein [Nitrospirae bacterium]|nr:flavin reductase family protein [Nitrospirota bacterium]
MKKSLGAKTILYPTPVLVIGTYDESGKPNAMTASWAGICCSSPPCVAVSIRKATSTYGNLTARKAFTVNIPSEHYLKDADYFGTVSGRQTDKFVATSLTPVRSELVDAPYIAEFPFVLECQVLHAFEIGLHTQFVGEVMDAKAEERVLDEKGNPDIEKVKPALFVPESRCYYGVGRYLGMAFSIGKR